MTRNQFKKRGKILPLLFMMFVFFTAWGYLIGEEDPNRRTGLILPTEQEKAKLLQQGEKIDKVVLTDMGYNRIVTGSAQRGLAVPAKSQLLQAQAENADALLAVLPASVDNSTLKYFPPIRTQGGLLSCVPFSIVYYQLTYEVAKALNWDTKNENNALKCTPKWVYNAINGGGNYGTSWTSAYEVLKKHGCALWSEFPYGEDGSVEANYRQWCSDSAVWRNALNYRIEEYPVLGESYSQKTLNLVKQLLNNGEILIFGTGVYSWQFTTIPNHPSTTLDDSEVGKQACYYVNGYDGSHSMTIVGYNDNIWIDINGNGVVDTGEKGALRIANSWGPEWMDSGFTWLSYDALKKVSAVPGGPSSQRIQALYDMIFTLRLKQYRQPRLLAEFNLLHPYRNQIQVNLGYSDVSSTVPDNSLWVPADYLNGGGGTWAFDGTQTPVAFTFVLDFTDMIEQNLWGPGTQKKWYLRVQEYGTEVATVNSFKLIDVQNNNTVVAATGLPLTADNGWIDIPITRTLAAGSTNYPPVVKAFEAADITNPVNTLQLDGQAMDDGKPAGSSLTYAWSVVDGPGSVTFSNPASASTTATLFRDGTYTLRLTVSDSQYATHADKKVFYHSDQSEIVLFSDDFETNLGWTVNPAGSDTATLGLWERGVPQKTTNSGYTMQLATTVNGTNDLVTGRLAGTSAGAYDLDGGKTSIRSPNITLPSLDNLQLSFSYYLAHYNNSGSDDYLRVKVVGSTTTTVLQELGAANIDAATWAVSTTDISSFKGQTVYILIEANDSGTASLVEAAVDNLSIKAILNPCGTSCIAPAGLQATNIIDVSADLSWNAVSGASYYAVEFSQSGSGYWQLWGETTYTSMKLFALYPGVIYEVRIKTYCGDCQSTYSPTYSFTTIYICNPPTNPFGNFLTPTSIDLNWENNPMASAYEYCYHQTGSVWGSWINVGNATCVSLSGLTPDTDYEFKVRSVCPGGTSAESAAVPFRTEPACPCPVPANMRIDSIGLDDATFSWDTVAECHDYEFAYRLVNTYTWQAGKNSTTTVTLSGLQQNAQYEFKVRSLCGACSSTFTNSILFTTSCDCPAPTNLAIQNITNASAELVFTPVSQTTAYKYQVRMAGEVWPLDWLKINANPMPLEGLQPNMTYEVRMQSACMQCDSPDSQVVSFTTSATSCVCDVPQNLIVQQVTATTATLSWSAVSGSGKYHYQYRIANGTWSADAYVTATSMTLSGLQSTTSYEFRVYAECLLCNSDFAGPITLTTLTPVTYCASQSNNCTYEWIGKVQVGTSFTNSSTATKYSDFTARIVPIVRGQATAITLTPNNGSSSYTEYWHVWIDLNKDGDFADSGEQIFTTAKSGKTAVTGTINISTSQLKGLTRMRISMKYGSAPVSCGTFSYGEVEDYTADIQ